MQQRNIRFREKVQQYTIMQDIHSINNIRPKPCNLNKNNFNNIYF